MSTLPVATDQTFSAEVLQAPYAVVDFWGAGCPGCEWLEPTIEQLAEAYAGRVKVVSVDVDTAIETVTALGLAAIPTVVFYKAGREVSRIVGAHPLDRYASEIAAHFKI